MKRVRGGAGLGDSVYIRAIAEQMLSAGEKVEVCTRYPEVFLGLPISVKPFDRNNIQVLAHYTSGKLKKETNQWQDVCESAKMPFFPLRISWEVQNYEMIKSLREEASGRPIVMLGAPHAPMDRTDGFGKELLPEKSCFDEVLASLSDCFLVKVGKGEQPYQVRSDRDMNGSTSVSDILDLGASCDLVVGQCSFVIPIAEAFDKPLLIVWAAAGLAQSHYYIKSITPQKVLSKASSRYVVDDWKAERVGEESRAFRRMA